MEAISSVTSLPTQLVKQKPGLDLGEGAATTFTVVSEVISARPITEVWIALGGPSPRRGRACAFFRGGDNPFAVSLNDAMGCWFDHRDGVGGGVLDLVQRAHGCDRRSALRWLTQVLFACVGWCGSLLLPAVDDVSIFPMN
jgi:hypothetical protein